MPKQHKSGFTLVEIIVSVAILGLLVSMFLSAFYSGATSVIFSGLKSRELLQLQSIIDDLNKQTFLDGTEIDTFLGTPGYEFHSVTDINQLPVMVSGEKVNYYISPAEPLPGVIGYSVTIVRFIDSGKRSARLTTFIMIRG